MSVIRPFPAIRYATSPSQRDLSRRLSPPYDVLDQADKDRLLGKDPQNFVKIDLPHVPPKTAGPPAAYEGSNQTLRDWLAAGTLTHDAQPALYVYHQQYEHAGESYTRKMFFARLRLEPFGTGGVFPHEQTFGGPKEDRLALTKATRTNLSPIFGLYQDPANEVSRRLEAALPPEPLAVGELDGVRNTLWAVQDPQQIESIAGLMQPKPIFIADGHHRYGTALLYRDWLTEQQGGLPADRPANFVLCVFCAMEDPGLLILPTHRVLTNVPLSADLFQADGRLEVAPLTAADAEEAVRALARYGPQAVALHTPAEGGFHCIRPRETNLLDPLEPKHSEAWRRLGLAFLHAYLLERVVQPQKLGGQAPTIQYVKSAAGAVTTARETQGSVFLLQPTTMAEMRDVCSAGDLMPQKSTYFYPKLASGLVINPLE